jgi:hypothetical protein
MSLKGFKGYDWSQLLVLGNKHNVPGMTRVLLFTAEKQGGNYYEKTDDKRHGELDKACELVKMA